MKRKTALITAIASVAIVAGGIGLMAMFPGTDWSRLESAEAVAGVAAPESAHPAITGLLDQGNPNKDLVSDPNDGVRRVWVGIECPEADIAPCGASAMRAASIWLEANGETWGDYQGEPVTDLLFMIEPMGQNGGFGMLGPMPSAAALANANADQILNLFSYAGAGENGEIALARWCGANGQGSEFCTAFYREECAPAKHADVVAECPADLLRR